MYWFNIDFDRCCRYWLYYIHTYYDSISIHSNIVYTVYYQWSMCLHLICRRNRVISQYWLYKLFPEYFGWRFKNITHCMHSPLTRFIVRTRLHHPTHTPPKAHTTQGTYHTEHTPCRAHNTQGTHHPGHTIQGTHHTGYTPYRAHTIQGTHHTGHTPYRAHTIQGTPHPRHTPPRAHHVGHTPYILHTI